jgi:hypothetical protein
VASGGYRSNAGRPKGAKNVPKAAPEADGEKSNELENSPPRKPLKSYSREQAELVSISYLAALVEDVSVDRAERTRSAIALLGLTRAKPPVKRPPRDPVDDIMAEMAFGRRRG